MKSIINGKVYNTETAEYITSWNNCIYTSGARYVKEDLYITKKGQYFVAEEGLAYSYYGKFKNHCGIRLITKEEILELLEKYEMYEEIEEYFSDILEEG